MRSFVTAVLVVMLTLSAWAAGVVVQGKVIDPGGSVIPGATVELVSAGKAVASTVSGADGTFRFANVAAGSYEIRVTLSGFRQSRAAVTVGGSSPAPLTIKLLVGSLEESITVTSGSPAADSKARKPAAPPPPAAPRPLEAPRGVGGGVPDAVAGGVVGGVAGGMATGGSGRYAPGVNAYQPPDAEAYAAIDENTFRRVTDLPLSTFSIDVDTASYTNVRRFLNEGRLPPADAVRVEELINYFHFDYADGTQGAPFGVTTELMPCPWNARHQLALVGLQARRLPPGRTPPRNLVFLLDVSGSMSSNDKLPLVKTAMKMLAGTLNGEDSVAIVTYAGWSRVALSATRGDRKPAILDAIDALSAGGSTNGGAGIQQAYDIAQQHFVKGGINRVILATDGDFNVGVTDMNDLTRLIEDRRGSGVFLSVLGVGTGNLKDATMERLADKGNGNYSYLDSLDEARRVLVAEAGSTLVTVAKDVKIQVEFNPAKAAAYRLVGYENRRLKARDFNDDQKDAGEMGAGHAVTALYEIVPPGEDVGAPGVDPLKYQRPVDRPEPKRETIPSNELMTVKVRYKQPSGDTSTLVTVPVVARLSTSPRNAGFAAAVGEFGMLLRNSPYKADATWEDVVKLARENRGADPDGYRAEFVRLVELAASLDRQNSMTSISRR